MELWELKNKIKNNSIPNLLIFTGPECGLMDIYINQIKQILGLEIKRNETVISCINTSKLINLIETKYLFIVRGDKNFLKDEKLQEKAQKIKGVLIVIYDTIDKRSKLYKQFEENIITFDYMDDKTLIAILKKNNNLTDDQLKWLIYACGHDYNRCLLELNKISLFDGDKSQLFEKFKRLGAFHEDIGEVIFQFVDSVAQRKPSQAWKLYSLLKLKGESNIKIISLLYSRLKNILIVQFCNNPTVENTGLTPYQITISKSCINRYSDKELLGIIDLLRLIDSNIKNGIIEEQISVEYLLATIL